MQVLIAGGGVGGLTLALMLHQRGIACTVFEAAGEMRELGVGINILPHGIAELAGLGLLEALDAVAIRTRELRYLNHLGQTFWAEPRGLHAGHPMPQFSIHRGRLHGVLWQAARGACRPGAFAPACAWPASPRMPAASPRASPTRTAHREARGDVLVGADGIHSALRALLHPMTAASAGRASRCGAAPSIGRPSRAAMSCSSPATSRPSWSSTRSARAARRTGG